MFSKDISITDTTYVEFVDQFYEKMTQMYEDFNEYSKLTEEELTKEEMKLAINLHPNSLMVEDIN